MKYTKIDVRRPSVRNHAYRRTWKTDREFFTAGHGVVHHVSAAPTRPNDVTAALAGRWVRIGSDGQIADSDVSVDALLARYGGGEPPHVRYIDPEDNLVS